MRWPAALSRIWSDTCVFRRWLRQGHLRECRRPATPDGHGPQHSLAEIVAARIHPANRPYILLSVAYCPASSDVSAPEGILQVQFPTAVPGVFSRASEPR